MSEHDRTPAYTVFLTVACLALAGLVVLLALQNRRLKGQVTDMQSELAVAEAGKDKNLLAVGDLFPAMDLQDGDGDAMSLAFDGGGAPRALLLFFSLDCPACQETLPIWEELYRDFDVPDVDVIAVRLGIPDTGPHHDGPMGLPVFDPVDLDAVPVDRLLIPATLVVDSHGFVEGAWYGVPTDRHLGEMESMLFR